MHGTVENVWENTREDGTVYWVLTIDGRRYSAFDPDLVQDVGPGDRVEFSYTSSGRYKNLLAIRRLTDQPEHPSETVRIVRMNSLRTAAELLRDSSLTPDQRAVAAIDIAEKLECHILRPERTEQDDEDPDADDEEDGE